MAFPALAGAQEGEVDPIPEPRPLLDGPHDPFGLGLKKISYSVGLRIVELYDNNIFLVPDGETSDFVTVFHLSADLRHDYQAGEARVNYRAEDRVFARQAQFNGVEHFLTASATLEPKPLKFEAGLDWKDLKDPFDVLQVTGHFDTHYDREVLKATADFNRFDVEVIAGLSHFTIDDEILDRGDYERRELAVTGLWEAWSQFALLAEIGIEETDYVEAEFSDFTFLRVTVGARGTPSPKTRIEAHVGLGRAEPDGTGILPVQDVTEFLVRASASWDIGERQELKLELRREPVESVETGLAIAEGVEVTYRHDLAERWSAQIMGSWGRRVESDGSGGRTGIQARTHLRWTSPGQVYADVGLLFRARDGDDPSLDYGNFQLSLGLGVQW